MAAKFIQFVKLFFMIAILTNLLSRSSDFSTFSKGNAMMLLRFCTWKVKVNSKWAKRVQPFFKTSHVVPINWNMSHQTHTLKHADKIHSRSFLLFPSRSAILGTRMNNPTTWRCIYCNLLSHPIKKNWIWVALCCNYNGKECAEIKFRSGRLSSLGNTLSKSES